MTKLTSADTDCYDEVVPNNLRCANPSWVLWTKEYREIGCCETGYVPTSGRYCVRDASKLGVGFSSVSPKPEHFMTRQILIFP